MKTLPSIRNSYLDEQSNPAVMVFCFVWIDYSMCRECGYRICCGNEKNVGETCLGSVFVRLVREKWNGYIRVKKKRRSEVDCVREWWRDDQGNTKKKKKKKSEDRRRNKKKFYRTIERILLLMVEHTRDTRIPAESLTMRVLRVNGLIFWKFFHFWRWNGFLFFYNFHLYSVDSPHWMTAKTRI